MVRVLGFFLESTLDCFAPSRTVVEFDSLGLGEWGVSQADGACLKDDGC